MKDVQAITVNYNTPILLRIAITSLRNVYPELPILIIDGSEYASHGYKMAERLSLDFTRVQVKHMLKNIGHGCGMNIGIEMTDRKQILIFDSDIRLLRPCVEAMKKKIDDKVLGVGMCLKVNERGYDCPDGKIPYLHPFFALINRQVYERMKPIKNHGAPMIDTMISCKEKMYKIVDYPLAGKVYHKWRGTRKINPQWFKDL